jgi:hypothetical protein
VSWRSIWSCGLLVFAAGMASGCYVYTPVAGPPEPGARLSFDLNDRGRVGLGERIGVSARKVEGTLKSNADSAYQLNVISVQYLNGERNNWTGEPLTVAREFVGAMKQRQFSRSRTWLTAAAIAVGTTAFIVTRGLLGSGSPERDPGGGEPGPQS